MYLVQTHNQIEKALVCHHNWTQTDIVKWKLMIFSIYIILTIAMAFIIAGVFIIIINITIVVFIIFKPPCNPLLHISMSGGKSVSKLLDAKISNPFIATDWQIPQFERVFVLDIRCQVIHNYAVQISII